MPERQTTLVSAWTVPTKIRKEDSSETTSTEEQAELGQAGDDSELDSLSDLAENDDPEMEHNSDTVHTSCTALCCSSSEKAFQPTDKSTLSRLKVKDRTFQAQWYKRFPWLTVCTTTNKAYCLYCRYATQHNIISFSKMGENAFTEAGFDNWRKAISKFSTHDRSHVHREAKLKWMSRNQPTIAAQMSSQVAQLQMKRRQGLLIQLRAIRYLTRQGIALRGHTELDGTFINYCVHGVSTMRLSKAFLGKIDTPVIRQ